MRDLIEAPPAQSRLDRKRERGLAQPFGDGEMPGAIAQILKCRLEVKREGMIDARVDLTLGEEIAHLVARRVLDRVLRVDVRPIFAICRKREEFLWDMRFELLRSGVDFEGVGSPLQKVSIYRRIYADGLNKSSFVETVQKVMRAVLIVTWMLRRKFGNALPESPSPWVH